MTAFCIIIVRVVLRSTQPTNYNIIDPYTLEIDPYTSEEVSMQVREKGALCARFLPVHSFLELLNSKKSTL